MDSSNAFDAEGFSMDENKVDAWGRPLLSDSKLRKLQTKMQAALLGTDPQKFLERYIYSKSIMQAYQKAKDSTLVANLETHAFIK